MYHIEYAALNYYHSPISDECLCVGVLFHNVTNGQRDFKYISNFQRFHAFDDEANIDFVKLYLRGIKGEVETSVFNLNLLHTLERMQMNLDSHQLGLFLSMRMRIMLRIYRNYI